MQHQLAKKIMEKNGIRLISILVGNYYYYFTFKEPVFPPTKVVCCITMRGGTQKQHYTNSLAHRLANRKRLLYGFTSRQSFQCQWVGTCWQGRGTVSNSITFRWAWKLSLERACTHFILTHSHQDMFYYYYYSYCLNYNAQGNSWESKNNHKPSNQIPLQHVAPSSPIKVAFLKWKCIFHSESNPILSGWRTAKSIKLNKHH